MRRAVFFTFLALLAGAPTGAAWAQQGRGEGRGDVLPLDRILPEVRRAHPGQFFDADGPRRGADGQEHYRLKWMRPDGRVEWLDADARTGRVIGPSQPDDPRPDMGSRPRRFEGGGGDPRQFRGDEDGFRHFRPSRFGGRY